MDSLFLIFLGGSLGWWKKCSRPGSYTLCVTLGNYLASLSCLNHCFL